MFHGLFIIDLSQFTIFKKSLPYGVYDISNSLQNYYNIFVLNNVYM